jgi:phosphate starvation-inducible PhoH-like protein
MRPESYFLPRSPAQVEARKVYHQSTISFFVGPAGVGKTHAAVALALGDILADKARKLMFVRPLVPCGEQLGFLKGNLAQKLEPWMASMVDVFPNMTHAKLSVLMQAGKIEQVPLAFMRGRTVGDKFICICDEAQNLTITQMRMFLSRIGDGGKMILTGDPDQSDLAREILTPTANSLESLPDVGVVHFPGEHTLRHPMIPAMLKRIEAIR